MARYPSLDWTRQDDYDAILAEAVARARAAWPSYTGAGDPGDPVTVLLETIARVGDQIRYYEDRAVTEMIPILATQRQNLIDHLALIGYVLASATPSIVPVIFSVPRAAAGTVTIAAGDEVTTSDGQVPFEVQDTVQIPPRSTSVPGFVIQGTTIVENLATSDGTANQRYQLARSPFLNDGSATVVVGGVIWTVVPNFLSSSATDQHVVLAVDEGEQATAVFGDGVNGAIPPQDDDLSVVYRIGGGTVGNVDANSITKLGQQYTDSTGASVSLSVTNPAGPTVKGLDREDTEVAKLNAPRAWAANNRCVGAADYVANALKVAGVARAFTQTVDDDPTLPEETVFVRIVPVGGGDAPQPLLDAVRLQLTTGTPKMQIVKLWVGSAPALVVVPTATVYIQKAQSGKPVSQTRVEAIGDATMADLVAFFDPLNVDPILHEYTLDFGSTIPLQRFYEILGNKKYGISYADLSSPAQDLVIPAKCFPRLLSTDPAGMKTIIPAAGATPLIVRYSWPGTGTSIDFREEP